MHSVTIKLFRNTHCGSMAVLLSAVVVAMFLINIVCLNRKKVDG